MEYSDFSDYIVHFTKNTERSAYDNVMRILYNKVINAYNAFGCGREKAPIIDDQLTVCFSEIPLHLLDRLIERRGIYGIGFRKEFALSKNALPVWYVEKDSKCFKAMTYLM